MKISIINPITYPNWNDLVLSHPNYSFFHSSNWAKVLAESYDYSPRYFTVMEGDKLSFLVPLMEVKSFLTGQRGVSLPFSDYCEPIIPDGKIFENVFESIIDMGKKDCWKYIEIRGGGNCCKHLPVSSSYYGHFLSLSMDEDRIFSSFRGSNKRNIRKAIKEGVEIRICKSLESIKDFYRLNCITRKKHGLPPQPVSFFKKIFDYVISRNHGIVVLADYKGRTISGAVYFHIGKKALYKYGASDERFQHLRVNNLVMWEAIKYYCRNDITNFSFGRTDLDHEGLRRFKLGWGARENIINYHKYDLRKKYFINGNTGSSSGIHNKVFRIMPASLSRLAGSVLYKHMG